MSSISKGGRGKRAPYQTVMHRTPEPIKGLAQELTDRYRELVESYNDPSDPELIAAVGNPGVDEAAIVLAAVAKFLEVQKANYGKNGAQKDKEFSMDTRKWDAFKDFKAFVENLYTSID